MFLRALHHVRNVREAVLAAALPDENMYMVLQQQSLFLTPTAADPTVLVPVSLVDIDEDRFRGHERVEIVKASLDGPMTQQAVRCAWCATWMMVPLVIAAYMLVLLVVWMVVKRSSE